MCGKQTLPLLILGKSRMRKRARTDLCGGRSAMVVPTATVIPRNVGEERALSPQSNSVKTFVMATTAPVPRSGKRLGICQFGWLRGSRKLMKGKIFWLRGVDLLPSRALIPRNLLILQ